MSFCNGKLYLAFTQADQEIVVLWNWDGAQLRFANHVKYADTAFYSGTDGYYAAPALACWKPGYGTYSDQTRLWMAFTGTDKKLYYGYHDDADADGSRIQVHGTVPNETSVRSPATSVQSQTLRLGWVGVNNRYMNFESTTDVSTWSMKNTWTANTAGAGFGMWRFCDARGECNLWFAWPGTDSGNHINIGYFSLGGGFWTTVANPLPNQTCPFCDLTIVGQDSILRATYAGRNLDPNVLSSSNLGTTWSNDTILFFGAVFGMSGAVLTGDHLWVSWVDNGDTQVLFGQYN